MVIMQHKETNETKRVLKTFHIGNFLGFPFIAMIPLVLVSKITGDGGGFIALALLLGLLYAWEKVSYNNKRQISQLKDAGFVEVEDTVGSKINHMKTKAEQFGIIAVVIVLSYFIIGNI